MKLAISALSSGGISVNECTIYKLPFRNGGTVNSHFS